MKMFSKGVMEYHREIAEYFKGRDVHAIFLFRRNHLRRMISLLANNHDKNVKVLNGTHKSHVHSPREVCSLYLYAQVYVYVCVCVYRIVENGKILINRLKYWQTTNQPLMQHSLYQNWGVLKEKQLEFLNTLKQPEILFFTMKMWLRTGL